MKAFARERESNVDAGGRDPIWTEPEAHGEAYRAAAGSTVLLEEPGVQEAGTIWNNLEPSATSRGLGIARGSKKYVQGSGRRVSLPPHISFLICL